jgi:hypothetical protein
MNMRDYSTLHTLDTELVLLFYYGTRVTITEIIFITIIVQRARGAQWVR